MKSESGRNILVNKLGLCGPLNVTNELDMADLVFTLGDELPIIVESGREEISDFCESLGNSSSKVLLVRYAAAVGFEVDTSGATCTTTEFVRDIQTIRKDSRNKFDFSTAEYQWLYQMCSEFGYFTTSLEAHSLLGPSIPVNFFTQQCLDLFGDQFTLEYVQQRVDHTNEMYGGLDVNATRVIFVHGSLDPWRVLGITETRNVDSPVVFIQGESHCTVDWTPQDTDPPELQEARKKISDILGQWLPTIPGSTEDDLNESPEDQQSQEVENEEQLEKTLEQLVEEVGDAEKLSEDEPQSQEVEKEEQQPEEIQEQPVEELGDAEQLLEGEPQSQEVGKEEQQPEEIQEQPEQEVGDAEQLLEESQELPPQELILQDEDLQEI